MFLVILSLLFAAVGGLCILRYWVIKKDSGMRSDWSGGAVFSWAVSIIFLIILVGGTLISYSIQLSDIEELKKIKASETIYKSKAEALTRQFAGYLAEAYPKHERDIFTTIAPEKVSLYMVKYPELQSSQTFVALVAQISKMQNDYYGQQLKAQDILQDMRFRKVNPWTINRIIPEIPLDMR